jgi:hypothetical protein
MIAIRIFYRKKGLDDVSAAMLEIKSGRIGGTGIPAPFEEDRRLKNSASHAHDGRAVTRE